MINCHRYHSNQLKYLSSRVKTSKSYGIVLQLFLLWEISYILKNSISPHIKAYLLSYYSRLWTYIGIFNPNKASFGSSGVPFLQHRILTNDEFVWITRPLVRSTRYCSDFVFYQKVTVNDIFLWIQLDLEYFSGSLSNFCLHIDEQK